MFLRQWGENSEVRLCKKMQCFEGAEWGSAAELLPRMPCVVEPCKIEKTVGRVVEVYKFWVFKCSSNGCN